jgi:IS30 family transposase
VGQRGVFVPIEKSTLVDLYWGRGLSIPKIADHFGVTPMTVHRKMLQFGIPRRYPGGPPNHGLPPPATVLTRRFLKENYQRRRMTMAEIAALTGYSASTVSAYLHRHGLPTRVYRPTSKYDIDRHQLLKFRRNGLTVQQIACQFNCSKRIVERALQRHGLSRH